MEEQAVKKIKTNQLVTSIASFIFVACLTIILTTSLTLAAFGNSDGSGDGGTAFGHILIDNAEGMTVNGVGALVTIGPGSTSTAEFSVENTGTADILLRYRLAVENVAEQSLDTSIFEIAFISAKYTIGQTEYDITDDYIYNYDFGDGYTWYVRKNPLVGNLNTETNDPPDEITMEITFPGIVPDAWKADYLVEHPGATDEEVQTAYDEFQSQYQNAEFNVIAYVQITQYANNGTQRDITLPDYDVTWAS